MTGPRFHFDRGVQIEKPEDGPKAVVAHVRKRTAAELIPATEDGMSVIRMIGAVERGPQPERPVETLRYLRRLGWNGRILRPHRPVGPIVDFPQRADDAVVDPALNRTNVGAVAGGKKVRGDLRSAGGLDNQPGFMKPVGNRLMHQDVLAFFHGRNGDRRVKMVGRHDFERVHVLFLFQKLPKIRIGSATVELLRSPLVGIRRLDDFPGDLPPSGNARRAPSPIGPAERGSDCCPQPVLGPVHIIVAVFDRIADGDDLDLRHGQQRKHFPQSLRTATDVRQSDLFAGRDKSLSTQHVPRNDRKGGGGGAASPHEVAPGEARAAGLPGGIGCLHFF